MAAHCYASLLQKLGTKAFKYVSDALVYEARMSGTVLKLKINNCEGQTVKAGETLEFMYGTDRESLEFV